MAEPHVAIRDQTPRTLAPVDESVVIPQSIRDAAARADAFYAKPAAAAPDAPEPQTPADPPAQPDPALVAPPAQPDPPPVADPPVAPEEKSWEHKYNSMKGRFDASQRTIGGMQEQLTELGNELMQTQALIGRGPAPVAPTPERLLTAQDEENYGSELIDLAKRAAKEAVAPQLATLQADNADLAKRLARATGVTLAQSLDQSVPTWREINKNPRFKTWLHSRDVYSGVVRGELLDKARRAADAPRVASFFKGFLQEEAATGNAEPTPQPEPPAPPVPRQAAVPLASLAAPGRARPAGGDGSPMPVDKPVFTRTQISSFYKDVSKGVYVGREAEKLALEKQIFAAQSDGRVRG